MLTSIKRNIFILKELLVHSRSLLKVSWNSLQKIQRLESLNTKFSYFSSSILYNRYKKSLNNKDKTFITINDQESKTIIKTFKNKHRFIEHNILVIKKYYSAKEKGILLIKYTEIINALPALIKIKKLAERYHFVFIPSTESPFNPFNLLYRSIYDNSIVMTHYHSQREKKVFEEAGLATVDLCAGDWINNNNFSSEPCSKIYDFCVVANFNAVKNYDFLLKTLQKWPKDKPLKFAVVASSHVGLKKQWFENLLKKFKLENNCYIYTDISSKEVNFVLNSSYCHVLCSWREGANKASFEAMLSGIPAIVPQNHIGFPVHKFNHPHILKYQTEKELVERILEAKTIQFTEPPELGYQDATRKLNARLKDLSLERGFHWTQDIVESSVTAHLHYINVLDVQKFKNDYEFIEECKLNDLIPYCAEIAQKKTILKYD